MAAKLISTIYREYLESSKTELLSNIGMPGEKIGQKPGQHQGRGIGDSVGQRVERPGEKGVEGGNKENNARNNAAVVEEDDKNRLGNTRDSKNAVDGNERPVGSRLILDIDEDYFGVEVPGKELNRTGADVEALHRLSDVVGKLVCDVGSRHDERRANAALRGITGTLLNTCGGQGKIAGGDVEEHEVDYETKTCQLDLVKQLVASAREKIESLGLSCVNRKPKGIRNGKDGGENEKKGVDKKVGHGVNKEIEVQGKTTVEYQRNKNIKESEVNEENKVKTRSKRNKRDLVLGKDDMDDEKQDNEKGFIEFRRHDQIPEDIKENMNEVVEDDGKVELSLDEHWLRLAETISTFQVRHLRELHSLGWCADVPIRMASSTTLRLCLGLNDYGDENLATFTPTTEEIRKRESRLARILARINKVAPPGVITVARSVKDGYTPRQLAAKVEKAVLGAIDTTIDYAVTHYDAYLWGGVKGWQDRNA